MPSSGSFVIFQVDRRLEPVRLHDQEIARQVLERALCGRANEQAFPAVPCYSAHDDNVGTDALCDRR